MDGRCLMTTSRAWIVSKGTLGSRPESASCNACKLTQDTHLMDTLKMRSFPSPGSVTSSSTWEGTRAHGYSSFLLRKPEWGASTALKGASPWPNQQSTVSVQVSPLGPAQLLHRAERETLSSGLAWGWWVCMWKAPHPSWGQLSSRAPEVSETQPVLHPRAQGRACPPPGGPDLPSLSRDTVAAGARGQHCWGLGGFHKEETPGRGKRDAGTNKAALGTEEGGVGSSLGVLGSYSFSGGTEKTAEDLGWGVPVSWVSESIS